MSSAPPYQYYKFEANCPLPNQDERMFWGYEQMFEQSYALGNFSPDFWFTQTMTPATKQEMTDALATKDKEEIFKVWLYNLLWEYLPDKHMAEEGYFHKRYWAIISTSM